MIAAVQPLLKTLLDIIFLRKGPEAIPYSNVLAGLIVAFWLMSSVVVSLMLQGSDGSSFFRSLIISMIAIAAYAAVLVLAQKTRRMLQTFSAILGCGALISLAAAAGVVIFSYVLDETWAALIALLIIFWSVPVEGHIIARAIDRHWYVGIVIAGLVFVLQLYIELSIMPPR